MTLGEGPGTEALGEDRPVLVSALRGASSLLRWPAFAPAAVAAARTRLSVGPRQPLWA